MSFADLWSAGSAGEKWCSAKAANPGGTPAQFTSGTASLSVRGTALL